MKEGLICQYALAIQKSSSPTLGAKSVTQCSWHSLCPKYTGVVPATYAGPGQLGFEGLPHGKCDWVMQVVNNLSEWSLF